MDKILIVKKETEMEKGDRVEMIGSFYRNFGTITKGPVKCWDGNYYYVKWDSGVTGFIKFTILLKVKED